MKTIIKLLLTLIVFVLSSSVAQARGPDVIAAGLDNRMGSVWAHEPEMCEWEVQKRANRPSYFYLLSASALVNPLIWPFTGLRMAQAFRCRLSCLAVGYEDIEDNWTDWSDWSKRIYTGPEIDIDGDGVMGTSDLVLFRQSWGQPQLRLGLINPLYNPAADMDHNGGVGMSDLALLRVTWEKTLVGNRWE